MERPGPVVTPDDLDWWLGLAPTLRWRPARTYEAFAPHSYVVRDKTITGPDLERAVRVIRTFGAPGMYWSHTQVYLTAPVGPAGQPDPRWPHDPVKWWAGLETPATDLSGNTIINMAAAGPDAPVYGSAVAPRTHASPLDGWAPYDSLAVVYDARYDRDHCPDCQEENDAIRRLVARRFGAYAPTILDVGCGTGLVLDLGLTSPHLYTGVDESAGMLNELVRKHPTVPPAALVPGRVEDYLAGRTPAGPPRPGEFEAVLALFGVASYLDPRALAALPALSSDLTLLMCYQPGYLPDYWQALSPTGRPVPDHVDAARAVADDLYGSARTAHVRGDRPGPPPARFGLGAFEVTVL